MRRRAQEKLSDVLNRNRAATEAYHDLLEGAFVRLFNTGEMAGQCHGKGSENYGEYCNAAL